jgi:hypothetical protein
VMAVQNAVAYEQLGSATSGTTLSRSIGGCLGTALFGGIFTYGHLEKWPWQLPHGTLAADDVILRGESGDVAVGVL